MKLERADILCPNMQEKWGAGDTQFCDNTRGVKNGWRVRKLYPVNFNCALDGKCVGRNPELRVPEMECEFREDCPTGSTCPGPGGNPCTLQEIAREKIIRSLKLTLQNPFPPLKEEALYELTLAKRA